MLTLAAPPTKGTTNKPHHPIYLKQNRRWALVWISEGYDIGRLDDLFNDEERPLISHYISAYQSAGVGPERAAVLLGRLKEGREFDVIDGGRETGEDGQAPRTVHPGLAIARRDDGDQAAEGAKSAPHPAWLKQIREGALICVGGGYDPQRFPADMRDEIAAEVDALRAAGTSPERAAKMLARLKDGREFKVIPGGGETVETLRAVLSLGGAL